MPRMRKMLPAELPEPEIIDPALLADSCLSGETELICVLGPTASGKTRYAVNLAHQLPFPCEIISADSRQVYRGMDIGTGKDLEEYGEIPYHLIDIAEPGSQYNVHQYCRDFAVACSDIRSRKTFPILCGGTGLYISAVTGGYDFENRKPLSAPIESSKGSRPLENSLEGRAAGSCEEGCLAEKSFAIEPQQLETNLPKTFFIGTLVSREERREKINARLKARLKEGLIEEVRGLLDGSVYKPVSPERLISYGLEYKFVTLYLMGQLSEEELFTKLSTAIHQFAKRQMTWFRGMERSGIRIHWVDMRSFGTQSPD